MITVGHFNLMSRADSFKIDVLLATCEDVIAVHLHMIIMLQYELCQISLAN